MADTPNNDDGAEILEGKAETVEISDVDEPAQEQKSPRRHLPWGLIVLAAALVVAVAVAAVAIMRPEYVHQALGTAAPASSGEIAAIKTDVSRLTQDLATVRTRTLAIEGRIETMGGSDELAARVAALEGKAPSDGAAPAEDTEARRQVGALGERIAALEGERAELAALAERLTQDQQSRGTASADAASVAEEAMKLAQQQQQALADRDAQIAALKSDNDRVTSLLSGVAERLATLENVARSDGGEASKRAALVLAAGQLREALAKGGPFKNELASLRALGADDEVVAGAVSVLAPLAAAGVPTRGMLAERFDAMARKVIQAGIKSDDPGIVDRALARLAGLVTIRRTGGDVEGDTPSAVLARAEARLEAGDLGAAVKTLAALNGAAAEAAAPWVGDAKSRLAADEAAAELSLHAIGRMADTASTAGSQPGAAGGGTMQ